MEIIPKLALEVLEADLEILPRSLQLNLVELLLDLAPRKHLLVAWLSGDTALQVMKVGMLEGIELWEVVLRENDVLSEEASLQLQEAVSDGLDGVLETLVARHVVHILEDLCHVRPILHHEHTRSIDVEDLH